MHIAINNQTDRDFYRNYLTIVNFALSSRKEMQLTETELNLLVEFLLLPEKFKYTRFSTLGKSKVAKTVKELFDWYLSRININNKIYSMVEKGFLRRDDDGVIYLITPIQKGIEQALKAFKEGKQYSISFDFSPIKESNTDEA
jgi:hypothetical protein